MSDLLRRTLVFTVLILNKVESTSVELRNVRLRNELIVMVGIAA